LILLTLSGGAFFPIIMYSDKTKCFTTRSNRRLHPVLLFPAGLPRHLRKTLNVKRVFAYISDDADLDEAMNIIGEFYLYIFSTIQ
jgi:hypothetical protein